MGVAGEPTTAAVFVLTQPHSDAFFVAAFPAECTERFQEGPARAFAHFGGVPTRISYDNSRLAVATIVSGRGWMPTREFLRLQNHFLFAHHFRRVRRANEKGHVEAMVGFARRNFLVPIPEADSWEGLNAELVRRCEADLTRRVREEAETKADRLVRDRAALRPPPAERFEARRVELSTANTLSLVRFDRNDDSVPMAFAHQPITASAESTRSACSAGTRWWPPTAGTGAARRVAPARVVRRLATALRWGGRGCGTSSKCCDSSNTPPWAS